MSEVEERGWNARGRRLSVCGKDGLRCRAFRRVDRKSQVEVETILKVPRVWAFIKISSHFSSNSKVLGTPQSPHLCQQTLGQPNLFPVFSGTKTMSSSTNDEEFVALFACLCYFVLETLILTLRWPKSGDKGKKPSKSERSTPDRTLKLPEIGSSKSQTLESRPTSTSFKAVSVVMTIEVNRKL